MIAKSIDGPHIVNHDIKKDKTVKKKSNILPNKRLVLFQNMDMNGIRIQNEGVIA